MKQARLNNEIRNKKKGKWIILVFMILLTINFD